MGFSFSGAAPNQGLIFASLKPFDEREGAAHSAQTVIGRICGQLAGISGAIVVSDRAARRFPASARSAGSSSRCSTRPAPTSTRWRRRRTAMVGAGNRSPRLHGLFTLVHRERSAAARPDRSRARAGARAAAQRDHERAADLPRLAVRERLRLQQPRLPRLRAGRQGSSAPSPQRLKQIYVRTATGRWSRSTASCRVEETTAPQVISHFNLFRSATINGSAAPGCQLRSGAAGNGADLAGRDAARRA